MESLRHKCLIAELKNTKQNVALLYFAYLEFFTRLCAKTVDNLSNCARDAYNRTNPALPN